jgi:hypothetical protein
MTAHILRIGAAVVLVWFAIYGIDKQHSPAPSPEHDSPAADSTGKLAPVAAALRQASAVDRALWAEVWEKAAGVVAGDEVGQYGNDVILTDTKSLRAFTVICFDIAWNRIAGNAPGKYVGLREATEAFLADPAVLGKDDVAVTPELRKAYIKAAKSLAWAGINKG